MTDTYFIDLCQFSIDKFRNILKTKEILPGRSILKENIDNRFEVLKSQGITSLMDLSEAVKTKPKIEKFAKETGLSIEYITILRREANSYLPSPVNLVQMPFTETETVKILQNNGLKDSHQFFNQAAKLNDREKLAQKLKLPINHLTELAQLCDLVRITGVGPVFARIIYDSGIHCVHGFLSTSPKLLLEKLTKTNNEKSLTKAKFALKDIEYCLELGKELPIILEF